MYPIDLMQTLSELSVSPSYTMPISHAYFSYVPTRSLRRKHISVVYAGIYQTRLLSS
jgi:hypothetical protein